MREYEKVHLHYDSFFFNSSDKVESTGGKLLPIRINILNSMVTSGIYFGYGIRSFKAEGLNNLIDVYNANHKTLVQKMDQFGTTKGFKIGANLFQFNDGKLLFATKLGYSWMNEKNEANLGSGASFQKREYDLTLYQYSGGIAFSYYMGKRLDIKIVEASITLNNASFTNRHFTGTTQDKEETLKNPVIQIGFNVETGLIIYIVPPYISIEGTFGYSSLSIDEMDFENGNSLTKNENSSDPMDNFISGGGIFAFVTLNLSIPF